MSIIAPSRRRAVLLLALAAGAASCARYTPAPPLATVPLARDLAGLPSHPLSVAEVVALAVARDPDLVAARTRGGVTAAQLVQAGILPNPALAGSFLPLIAGFGVAPA